MKPQIRAAIFDKDGTLFDFRSSWGAWTKAMLAAVTQSAAQAQDLAAKLGYDPLTGAFARNSMIIAHSTHELADFIAEEVKHPNPKALRAQLEDLAQAAPMIPAVDLPLVLDGLRSAGIRIGLATNDTEGPARHHLHSAGILPYFDFIAGCDSGWGGKPAPGQLLAFAAACDLHPAQIVMVGDSVHDMQAGANAGMARAAVLTGIADTAELAPHADVVLPDIGRLLDWITSQNTAMA